MVFDCRCDRCGGYVTSLQVFAVGYRRVCSACFLFVTRGNTVVVNRCDKLG